ncbi:glycoside hydrolase family 13 protein [Hygrophoropsis aurantiaca]|uniref:Glycoside hydrolase family 13 protein n=1 Tax=Hygrophoropsis aurantiaca TaxID=72124 RepID=A0ACB8AR21_9AGAM|nr:glycoside hydrolase family 13 protein [Hygrophoropsis aurantiaca]
MDFYQHFRKWLRNLFWKHPPALTGMKLGPETQVEEGSQNPLMLQFFTWDSRHRDLSWWEHFESEIPILKDKGFTQVWLPPPNKAMEKNGRGYDAYDLWDLGEFDQKGTIATRWGTRDQLLKACDIARQYNLGVIIDAVLNHKLGGDRMEVFSAVPVDPTNRMVDIGQAREIGGWTAFDFSGRLGKYSSFRWTYEHFTGLDWDHLTQSNNIYRVASKQWSRWVDKELGNYDYLLGIDIDHQHQDVSQDLFAWGSWILDTTGGSGFRLDAIKHMDRRFLLDFIKRSRSSHPDRQRLFAVAEYWSDNLKLILPYVRAFQGQTAFFDVPLHSNFHRASKQGKLYDLRTIFNSTLVKARPGDAVTFVDNHDTQIGQSLESWVGTNFKCQAYALVLLRDGGYPCVFYGDLYPNEECYDEATSRTIESLLAVRKSFAYGPTTDYFKHRNCIGFVRMGNAHYPGCAVVISNGENETSTKSPANPPWSIRMRVGREHGGKEYQSYFDHSKRVKIDSQGWGIFSNTLNNGQVEVWINS